MHERTQQKQHSPNQNNNHAFYNIIAIKIILFIAIAISIAIIIFKARGGGLGLFAQRVPTNRTGRCIFYHTIGQGRWYGAQLLEHRPHRSQHNHNHTIGLGRWSGAQLFEHRPYRTDLSIIIIIQSVWGDGLGFNFSSTDPIAPASS